MDLFTRLLNAQLDLGFGVILWREVIGNGFGLASAILGARRTVWAWPIGIIGNVLLFTVFLGGVFHTPQNLDLYGQAGRQVFFVITSVYGWVQWWQYQRRHHSSTVAVEPRWASARERLALVVAAVVMLVVFALVLGHLHSYAPWVDSWILTGSILATYGMARGWNEFWLIWIAVDMVGVPLLFQAGYYPSALLYAIYAVFVFWGFLQWRRATRQCQRLGGPDGHLEQGPDAATDPSQGPDGHQSAEPAGAN